MDSGAMALDRWNLFHCGVFRYSCALENVNKLEITEVSTQCVLRGAAALLVFIRSHTHAGSCIYWTHNARIWCSRNTRPRRSLCYTSMSPQKHVDELSCLLPVPCS